MTCCTMDVEGVLSLSSNVISSEEALLASQPLGSGLRQSDFSVPGVHCGACISTIEKALIKLPYVKSARVNLTAKRVSCVWYEEMNGSPVSPAGILSEIAACGYQAHLFTADLSDDDRIRSQLLLAVGVSGFAAANIMLLSVSIWSGAEAATRDMFHWISAMIAAPTLIYAGRFFYQSAWNALKHGRTNMDVPISLAVTLSYSMSLWETIHHGEHAWFDASVSLLFFLLIGRTLDHVMRDKARAAITGLARLAPRGALLINPDGSRRYVPLDEINVGDLIAVPAGERIPVDATVVVGQSEVDLSIVTGESIPLAVSTGSELKSGAMNLTGSLTIKAAAAARNSLLAEIIGLMEAAEGGRARYRRIADRAASYYSPAVHLLALMSFLGWGLIGGDWKQAMLVAVAVLIITCPCALGLAVPVVQVVAAGTLFRRGIMVKDGSAMERLAEIDMIAFDKTGTLTMGRPRLASLTQAGPRELAIAAGLAAHSRHPLSQALLRDAPSRALAFDGVEEIPGAGLQAKSGKEIYRLGNATFACPGNPLGQHLSDAFSEVVLSKGGIELARFYFEDTLRPDADLAIKSLAGQGFATIVMSGDRECVVEATAKTLEVDHWLAGLTPRGKMEECQRLGKLGHRVLMVGDGINDAPALSVAHVSMAPATAADVGRQAADLVFMHDSLGAVPEAISVSRQAARFIRQNFALAIGYNIIAVPIAIAGYATPLVAAVAMSTSSLIVVANALRLNDKAKVPGRRHPICNSKLSTVEVVSP
ncbi:cation transport ATPase nitrogen fixation protein FixI 3 (plasmid) [Rhizobium etli 8C-3]|uniref:Cation transport ATPase nitrogen fixation protein FixI 3 n=2 Tax=Rhizobium TaxID=379 RepID=A0A1L5PFC3_RHIET|nr:MULTISPECIES: cation-translocating P-type ATPase [Rhizobium]APO78833.1 cation transport ATPase nitrogen fixation protein FixI 3 [Rhizobium etli 8C-3]TCU39162.1 Cu2+-exporting ATPase [Rhizobium azibense]